MIHYDDVSFRYDPWPFGVAKNLFTPDLYDELSRTFPSSSLFQLDAEVGRRRLTLDGYRSPRVFNHFFKTNRAWGELRRYAESRDFLMQFLTMLADHGIDFGDPGWETGTSRRLLRFARALRRGAVRGGLARFRVELVLVILPADGGYLLPHTDAEPKAANIAVSMAGPGEWDSALGGSTDLVWPTDPRNVFSLGARRLAFDEVRVLERVAYTPNQAVIVVKTYNSWHSVGPMHCAGSRALRKTLNFNILRT
jgi:hypothetical protein